MYRWFIRLLLIAFCVLALPRTCPAPLIYRPGEGWSYEPYGTSKWRRTRAKDQLEVAQAAFDKKDYGTALKAARRVVRTWEHSDYAPRAQYLVARCYEAKGNDEKAFKEYQRVVERYPKIDIYDDILKRQFAIANRYLAGQWFKLWGYIPFFPSMDKTADMFDQMIRNGPYSQLAPQAQMDIGKAREKQKDYPLAVKAYERAADRYHDMKDVAVDALYKQGLALQKQAQTAEYDQSIAGQAIATFTDFISLYPNDPRIAAAEKIISSLKTEQARGSYQLARFYEHNKQWKGARIYYNDALTKDPNFKFAADAKQRLEVLNQKLAKEPPAKQ